MAKKFNHSEKTGINTWNSGTRLFSIDLSTEFDHCVGKLDEYDDHNEVHQDDDVDDDANDNGGQEKDDERLKP